MSAARTEPPGFMAFYAAYPRKEKRPAALKAWKAGDCESASAEVLKGLKRWQPEYAARPKDKIPHPSTWLNNRQWEDDPPSAPKNRGANDGWEIPV